MKPMVVPARVSRDSWSPQARLQLVASVLVMSGQSYGIGFFPETERERESERRNNSSSPPIRVLSISALRPSQERRGLYKRRRREAEGKKCNIGDSGETSGGGGRVIPPFPGRGSYTYLQCTLGTALYDALYPRSYDASMLGTTERNRRIRPPSPFPPRSSFSARGQVGGEAGEERRE